MTRSAAAWFGVTWLLRCSKAFLLMWSCWHEYSRNEQNTAQHFNSESCAPSLCSTAEMKPPLPQNQESAVFLPNGARCLTYAYSFVLFSNVKQYKQFLTSCYSFDNIWNKASCQICVRPVGGVVCYKIWLCSHGWWNQAIILIPIKG